MIRLREKEYPPPYQLGLVLRLLRGSDNDLALRILKASPLFDTKTIEVTHVNNYVETYERVDSVYPIHVPADTEMSVKVKYGDAKYHSSSGYRWQDPPMELDKRYHDFNYVTNIEIFSVDDSHMVLWYNLEDATDYITCVPKLIVDSGSKVRR